MGKNYPFFCIDCLDYCDNSNLELETGFSKIETKSPFNHAKLKHIVYLLEVGC